MPNRGGLGYLFLLASQVQRLVGALFQVRPDVAD